MLKHFLSSAFWTTEIEQRNYITHDLGLCKCSINKAKKPSNSGKLLMGSSTNLLQTTVCKQHNALISKSTLGA